MKRVRADRRRGPRACRAGFFLYELLFVIGLFAIVGLMMTRLFGATFRLGQTATAAQDHANTLDAVSSALRSDAWSATKFELTGDRSVTFREDGDRTIVWSINGETLTRKENDSPVRRWTIASGSTFAADGVALVFRLPAGGGEARFASQTQLLGRLAP